MTKRKLSKNKRRAWFNSLTDIEKKIYIDQKMAKREDMQRQSTCTVFPEVNEDNKADWKTKLKKKNPWLNLDDFGSELEHLNSLFS